MGLTSLKTQPPKDLRLEIFASDGKNAAGPTTVVAFKTTKTGIVDLKVLTAEQLKTLKHDDAANPNGTGRQPSTPIEQPVKVPTTPPPPANVPTSEEKLAPAIESAVKAKIHEQTKTEKITWQELDPEKTPIKALSDEKPPRKRSVSKKPAATEEKSPEQKLATPSTTPPPLIPPTSPAGRAMQRFASFFTLRRIIMAIISALLLTLIAALAKPTYQKISNWIHGWNTPSTSSISSGGNNASFIPSVPAPTDSVEVEVITHDLSTARRVAVQSTGVVPNVYAEQPTFNINITNSFNGSNNTFQLKYEHGVGNGSWNGSPDAPAPQIIPALAPNPGPTHDWQGSAPPQYAPAPDYPPQSYVAPVAPPTAVYAAPTYSAPYAYNVSYSYVPPINFGFSWGGGHYGGRGH
jgi:hypothetical protein